MSLISFHFNIDAAALASIDHKLGVIMANTEATLAAVAEIKAQLVKVSGEQDSLIAKIAELTAVIEAAEVPQSVTDALADVKTFIDSLDAKVDDLPATP